MKTVPNDFPDACRWQNAISAAKIGTETRGQRVPTDLSSAHDVHISGFPAEGSSGTHDNVVIVGNTGSPSSKARPSKQKLEVKIVNRGSKQRSCYKGKSSRACKQELRPPNDSAVFVRTTPAGPSDTKFSVEVAQQSMSPWASSEPTSLERQPEPTAWEDDGPGSFDSSIIEENTDYFATLYAEYAREGSVSDIDFEHLSDYIDVDKSPADVEDDLRHLRQALEHGNLTPEVRRKIAQEVSRAAVAQLPPPPI